MVPPLQRYNCFLGQEQQVGDDQLCDHGVDRQRKSQHGIGLVDMAPGVIILAKLRRQDGEVAVQPRLERVVHGNKP